MKTKEHIRNHTPANCRHTTHVPITLSWLVLVLTLPLGCKDAADPNTLAERIEGTWNCESAIMSGNPLDEAITKNLKLILTDRRYKTLDDVETLFDSEYQLDLAHDPARIDIIGTEGDMQGKAAKGIIQLKGDTLTICYTMPGLERPTTFTSTADSAAQLIIWTQ